MKPRTIFIRQGLLLLFLLLGSVAPAQGTKRSLRPGQVPGTFEVKINQGYLSLEANQAPLAQTFQEIGKQAGITIATNVGPEEKVTIPLEQAPLEDGIKQLAKNVTVFCTENPKDKSQRISRVVVLSEGSGVSGQGKASAQPVKINKPAPQPEPFKFEFDPGKSTEKEKPHRYP